MTAERRMAGRADGARKTGRAGNIRTTGRADGAYKMDETDGIRKVSGVHRSRKTDGVCKARKPNKGARSARQRTNVSQRANVSRQAHVNQRASADVPRKQANAGRRQAHTASVLQADGLIVYVTRKGIKNLHLRVQPPDGRIEVSAPHRISDAFIMDFVRAKRPWIESRLRAIATSPTTTAAEAGPAEQAEWKAVVAACVPVLVEKWAPVLGVEVGKLAYRNMKSRWGSCQPATGRICINTRLALYPPECLEYVVVHELCHLRVSGHGPAFWALVETALPHWKEARAKLRG